ncbi:hypothetical protein TNCV_1720721 [Trichonephila clavipes]|nr:hypothetical protein TNCV_1720721 [Trichonephila clavipes]
MGVNRLLAFHKKSRGRSIRYKGGATFIKSFSEDGRVALGYTVSYFMRLRLVQKKTPTQQPNSDRFTSILDGWNETITTIRLCRCPPYVHPSYCKKRVKDNSSDYITSFHRSIEQDLGV